MNCYYGEFQHTLDAQCRVSLPCEWRDRETDTELILAPTADDALVLLPPALLDDFFERMRNASVTNAKIQRALVDFGRLCKKCRCDRQGRIALDRERLNAIGVGKELLLSGAVTHIRLSAPLPDKKRGAETVAAALDALDEVNRSLGLDQALKNALGGK
ncbi:MAG: hypothetical protein MJ016_01640 [Victivallaceae bacterium]|nr:hypothetical protein [Victivallaceae bacterium]